MAWLQIASAVFSAIGAISQGQAAGDAADFNAAVQRQNAELALRDSKMRVSQSEREQFLRMGAIRAQYGAGGTGRADEGSVLDVLADTAAQGELEKQNLLYQGQVAARGYQNTATLDDAQGANAERSGFLQAGAELLGGGAKYYQQKQLKRT